MTISPSSSSSSSSTRHSSTILIGSPSSTSSSTQTGVTAKEITFYDEFGESIGKAWLAHLLSGEPFYKPMAADMWRILFGSGRKLAVEQHSTSHWRNQIEYKQRNAKKWFAACVQYFSFYRLPTVDSNTYNYISMSQQQSSLRKNEGHFQSTISLIVVARLK